MKKLLIFFFPLLIGVSCTAQETNADVNPKEAFELIQNKEVVIIDVRSSPEWDGGHIENALHINLYSDDFESELKKLDRSKEYVVYCHAGGRSATAASKMKELGFENVHNLTGGISAWNEEGLKTVD